MARTVDDPLIAAPAAGRHREVGAAQSDIERLGDIIATMSWSRRVGRIRWGFVFRAVATAAVAVVIARAVAYYLSIPDPSASVGADFRLYTDAARNWLATGHLYPTWQLAGPYQVVGSGGGDILYPPIMLLLFVPFTVLPYWLWVVAPILLTLAAIRRMHPAPWALAVIALVSVTHAVQGPFFWGTPVIWLIPAVAWGLLLGWPGVLVAMKPMFLPLVLPAMHQRSFWLGVLAFGLVALPFGTLWLDWLASIRNAGLDPTYGWTQVVPLSLPLVAWIARTWRRRTPG